jgi:DNA-binding LacI/PurR family transcriptional regulator
LLRRIDDLIESRYSAGFRTVQHNLPAADRVPILFMKDFDECEFRQWYERHRPDVVVTHNRRIAVGPWLRPLKLSVPKDVGWITLDMVPGDDQVSGIDARSELVGVAALDLVLDQMQRDESGIPPFQKGVFIEGVWREGKSLRRKAKKQSTEVKVI